ncbi:MAG: M23 family metallopeptidase, partial [Oscillospiraceae bacterium]
MLRKACETVKNAAEQKTAELLSTNSQDHSAAANSADSMVEGGHVVAEKTAHVAVFTVKTTVNIGSKIADAKATSKKIKDITAETHNLSTDAYVPDKCANPMSIKTREIQIENVKSREQPIIKTVPQQTNAHRVHTSNVKNRAMPKKPLASQYTINAALPEKGGSLQKQRMQQIKARTAAKTKIAPRNVKTSNTKIRKVGTDAKKAKQTKAALKLAQKTAQQAARVAKITAEKAAQTIKVIAKAVMSAIKACIAAMQSMFAALVAVGGTAFAVILIICLVALLAGSVLGIFFAAEPTGHGIPIQDAMSTLNEEYYKQIKVIQEKVPHDHVEIKSSDGVMGIRWEDVLAIYSAKITGADTPTEVVTIDDAKLNMIRTILVDMNSVAYKTRVDRKEITVPVYDADGQLTYDKNGEIITEIQGITETTLIIELQHKTPAQMASEYGFTAKQYSALALLEETQYATLWAQLLGGLTMNGSGEIISPDTDWKGTDIFAWPLPKSFSVTSRFGYRKDSFTGKISYHSGTDIAAPYGTPILAAASGTVTVANA